MIFLAGLVIDGGAALEVRQRAADIAEQAARAAGQQCDVGLLRSASECRITSQAAAEAAAGPYLQNNGVTNWRLVLFDPAAGHDRPVLRGAGDGDHRVQHDAARYSSGIPDINDHADGRSRRGDRVVERGGLR